MSASAGKPSGKFNRVRGHTYIMQRDEWRGEQRHVRYTAQYTADHCASVRPEVADDPWASGSVKAKLRHDVNREVYRAVVEEIKDIMELVGVPGQESKVVDRLHDLAWDLMSSGTGEGQTGPDK